MPSVVAVFPTLTEAQIACSALRSAGFQAEVLDEFIGRVLSVDLVGGFRVVAPDEQMLEAERFLDDITRHETD